MAIQDFDNEIRGEQDDKPAFPLDWAPGPEDGKAAFEAVLASYRSSEDGSKVMLPLARNRSFDLSTDY